jgi:glucose-1-phosphate thymidylyltransferase
MKIVIPLAGYGTRLRPHTWSKPKPLVNVAGKPVLGHVLDMFQNLPKIDEVIFIVGYLGEQVEQYVSDAYPGLKARYVVQEGMLGQSHAIWLAREGLSGPMIMTFVDTLIETDLSKLDKEPSQAIAWVKEVEDPRRFGVVVLDDQGKVERLIEKPSDTSNNLAVVGTYYFHEAEALIDAIETQIDKGDQLKGEWYLADAINLMLEKGLEMTAQTVEVWKDAGKPEDLLETNQYLLEHGRDNSALAAKQEGVVIVPPVFVDPTAQIEHSVIGPYVTIGAGCIVKRSMLQNSIVEAGSHITDCNLSGSLIGRGARITGRARSFNVGDSSEVDFA